MKTTPPLIGLIGRARSGKDTVASMLIEHGWTRHAFADPLREAALGLDPIVDTREVVPVLIGGPTAEGVRLSEVVERLGWEAAKDQIPEVRRTLQRLGTEAIRALDETFWIRALEARLDAATTPVVVTDVRFPNEAAAIKARGGMIARVVRDDLPATLLHPSETSLDSYAESFRIVNTGTLDELRSHVRVIARYLPA